MPMIALPLTVLRPISIKLSPSQSVNANLATRKTHKYQKDLSLAARKTHSKEAQDIANDNSNKNPKNLLNTANQHGTSLTIQKSIL
jgi:hypothetical protein